MSVEEIKKELTSLGSSELDEVAVFLSQLRDEPGSELEDFLRGRMEQAQRGEFSQRSIADILSRVGTTG